MVTSTVDTGPGRMRFGCLPPGLLPSVMKTRISMWRMMKQYLHSDITACE